MNNIRKLWMLTKRNIRLFCLDKGQFFGAMIAPLILLLLYGTFLASVYYDSFDSAVPPEISVDAGIIDAFVLGWLSSCLMAVCSVTIACNANAIMVQDRTKGVWKDLKTAPVPGWVISCSYFLGSFLVALLICTVIWLASLFFLANKGLLMNQGEILASYLDTIVLCLFGTAFSSVLLSFCKTDGQRSAVLTVVSTVYGFLCGAYMPISQFGEGLQKVLSWLPGTYGTSLLHAHYMEGAYRKLNELFPAEVLEQMRTSFDADLLFNNQLVTQSNKYAVVLISCLVLILLFVLIRNRLSKKGIA